MFWKRGHARRVIKRNWEEIESMGFEKGAERLVQQFFQRQLSQAMFYCHLPNRRRTVEDLVCLILDCSSSVRRQARVILRKPDKRLRNQEKRFTCNGRIPLSVR